MSSHLSLLHVLMGLLMIVHYSTIPRLSVRLLGSRLLSSRTRTCSPHSLDEYFNRSPFIFNRVTRLQHSAEEAVDGRRDLLPSR